MTDTTETETVTVELSESEITLIRASLGDGAERAKEEGRHGLKGRINRLRDKLIDAKKDGRK
jgi:hypothetical protein